MVSSREESIAAPDGGAFGGHLTVPERGNGPGLLLLQEIFGVGDFLKAKAADLAELGYVVLCPDVFWRVEPGIALVHDESALEAAFGYVTRYATEVDDDTKVTDLGAALDHLRSLPEVGDHQAGVIGYCLGGMLAFRVACHCEPDVCVSYYGSGIADRLSESDHLTCPILFHFGGNDPYIPNEQVDAIRARLGERPNVEIHVQHQAGHAFENHLAPQFHDPHAAAASWPLTVEFLQRTLH
ncbi:MAG TPA: dienelactone hydrolase family protein [Acidimicrobiales bacterium]|jgi:carboxymethylenebutenolidase|nr:dienelactone hydrolase family protein [Acidimicrobiales bacterium]